MSALCVYTKIVTLGSAGASLMNQLLRQRRTGEVREFRTLMQEHGDFCPMRSRAGHSCQNFMHRGFHPRCTYQCRYQMICPRSWTRSWPRSQIAMDLYGQRCRSMEFLRRMLATDICNGRPRNTILSELSSNRRISIRIHDRTPAISLPLATVYYRSLAHFRIATNATICTAGDGASNHHTPRFFVYTPYPHGSGPYVIAFSLRPGGSLYSVVSRRPDCTTTSQYPAALPAYTPQQCGTPRTNRVNSSIGVSGMSLEALMSTR